MIVALAFAVGLVVFGGIGWLLGMELAGETDWRVRYRHSCGHINTWTWRVCPRCGEKGDWEDVVCRKTLSGWQVK